jgi:hypothetical protein
MAAQNQNASPETKSVDASRIQEFTQPISSEKELYSWQAASRPFKKRGRQFWMTIIAMASLFGLILFLAEGVMPVLLIASIIFLYYVYSNVEPEVVRYKITTKGVRIENGLTELETITSFCFTKKLDKELLVLQILKIPGRLELVINTNDKDGIRKALSSYVTEEDIKPSNFDKMTSFLSEKLPQN